MNIAELFKKNFILVPVIASVLVGTFTGVRYIVSLTETINKNQSEITIIKEKNLKNQIKYISQITLNQNELMYTRSDKTIFTYRCCVVAAIVILYLK